MYTNIVTLRVNDNEVDVYYKYFASEKCKLTYKIFLYLLVDVIKLNGTEPDAFTMQQNKLKILMIGPSDSGKTQIANFISESINIEEAGTPRPTQGVRIVEFELSNLTVNGKNSNIEIELWDASGDHKFESCWPAFRVGVQGVILVCSPNTANVASREMELLYNYFVSQPKLSTKQCVLFYNCTDESDDVDALNLSSTFSKVSHVTINLKSGGNRLKIDFSNFIASVMQSINKEI